MNRSGFVYLMVYAMVVVAGLGAVAAVNFTIDPFNAYRVIDPPQLRGHRPELGTRIAKAEALRHGFEGADWDGLILGLSRSEFSIDPEHPAFGGRRVFNASLLGCDFYELRRAFDWAVANNDLQTVVIFAEFYMFNANERGHGDFFKSRFDPDRMPIVYHLESLTSIVALQASRDVLAYWKRNRPSDYTDRGYRPREMVIRNWSHRRRFEGELMRFLKKQSTYRTYVYDHSRLDDLAGIIATCRAREIDLHLVISPTHATHLEAIRLTGQWGTYEQWKRDLVSVVEGEAARNPQLEPIPLWDFSGYTGYRAEAIADGAEVDAMQWWWENSHYRKSIGDRILDTVLGFEAADRAPLDSFGVRLSAANVEERLAWIRDGRAEYSKAQPAEIEWVQRLSDEALKARHARRRIKEW